MSVLLLDRPSPGIARVLINRPEKRNAIDHEVRQALLAAMTDILGDPSNRAIVFGGAGGVFSAGGDLPSMVGMSEAQARDRMRNGHVFCRLVANAGIPVVSAIEGFAAGAAVGLALMGDHIVVGESSKILFPFLKLGLTPDWGTLYTLPQRIGLPAARRVLTDGKIISGAEAARIGLADEFVEGSIMDAAVRKAEVLAALPLSAFARMKARLTTPSASMEEELRREEDDQTFLLGSPEFSEGYGAFSEKRAADFSKFPAPVRG